jgi:hypothetical protein
MIVYEMSRKPILKFVRMKNLRRNVIFDESYLFILFVKRWLVCNSFWNQAKKVIEKKIFM